MHLMARAVHAWHARQGGKLRPQGRAKGEEDTTNGAAAENWAVQRVCTHLMGPRPAVPKHKSTVQAPCGCDQPGRQGQAARYTCKNFFLFISSFSEKAL